MEGIYKIVNKINGKYYLGGTVNFHVRRLQHFNQLRLGEHHSIYLQRAFDKYGEENFEFIIVEKCNNIKKREQELLNCLDRNLCYNVSMTSSGGDMISNHPDKERLIKEAAQRLLDAEKPAKFGEDNPNWKGGVTFCDCGARISSVSEECGKCRNRNGWNNPFWGKTHTEEFKERMREQRLGKYKGNQEKAVIIDDREYISLSHAAERYNVVPATILNRIKNKNFPEYRYK